MLFGGSWTECEVEGLEHDLVPLFVVFPLLHPAVSVSMVPLCPPFLLVGHCVLRSRQLHWREGERHDVACGRGWFKGRGKEEVQQRSWTIGCNIKLLPSCVPGIAVSAGCHQEDH